ncbi:MAG: phage shock protein PspA [Pseudomonadales bacterium]|nr:phage shock protein PspA [Pseudomonadales bacterium]
MGIFSRLSDIINSNITVLLDKAEDPEKMIRMVIQEMEETLVEVRSTSARIIADKKDLQRRDQQLARQLEDWQRKAELALSKGREDLAKAALLEKAAVMDVIAQIEEDVFALDESLNKLSTEIEQLQNKLNDARARQKTMIMRQRATESRRAVHSKLHSTSIDKAINRFDHFEKKIDVMESEIEAYQLGNKGIEAEFAALEKEGRVDQELADLKTRLGKNKEK